MRLMGPENFHRKQKGTIADSTQLLDMIHTKLVTILDFICGYGLFLEYLGPVHQLPNILGQMITELKSEEGLYVVVLALRTIY